ncbi:MAG TPA: amidohydrolase family protein [Gemmatimonadaceae bacterium]|nr:amidohydrolase family protein [Gemmatimonadaceae bacterium]
MDDAQAIFDDPISISVATPARVRVVVDSLFAAPHLRALPPAMVARWRDRLAFSAGLREGSAPSEGAWREERRFRAREIETCLTMVRDLHRGGARILAGTDGSDAFPRVVSGDSLHDELQLLVDAGLSPLEAWRSATHNAAEALGLRDRHG